MKQYPLLFRIFDFNTKKYLTPESKVYIGLDGKVVTPEGPDTADRYELSHSLPLTDINGKQMFTDDGFITIIGKEVVYATPVFNPETNSWCGRESKHEYFSLVGREFEILPIPTPEEIIAGTLVGPEIQAAWDKKAAELPDPQAHTGLMAPQEYVRRKEFKFGVLIVSLALFSPNDMPEDVWEEHFKAVLESDTIFSIKKSTEVVLDAEPAQETVATNAPVIYIAQKLQKLQMEKAPEEWHKLADVAAAHPQQPQVTKTLQRVQGTTLAVWTITRGVNTSVASDYFLITEKASVTNENTNS